ncbi:hypothetical protein [Patulibacter sp. SYSU D01012]|uniref:hypothetical protein n=1 Tax=Patulibacter sp. SYSU D01012 TaxID=2817381 RepID=UPI001B3022BA|nr:hypothetical protein [Patulibacter sp. SYSU D01012]
MDDAWLDRLEVLTGLNADAPPRPVDPAASVPGPGLPSDFRDVFARYGRSLLFGRSDDVVVRYAELSPIDAAEDAEAFGADGYAWSWFGGPWRVVGVSRSSCEPWSGLEVPPVPFVGESWGTAHFGGMRVRGTLVWAPPQGEVRPTALLSAQRAAAWILAMPAAEILTRVLLGLTGCPWLPGPDPALATPRGGVRLAEDTITAPSVETHAPELLDGAPLPPPDRARAERDLAELTALAPPPARPASPPAWETIAELLGGPVREDVRELLDTYGAGEFTVPENDQAFDVGFHPLRAEWAELQSDEALELFDVTDLHGTQPIGRLRAVGIGWLDGPEHDLWLYRCGDAHGLAHNDGDCVTRMAGSAASAVLDAIHGRGLLAFPPRDPDSDPHRVVFRRLGNLD